MNNQSTTIQTNPETDPALDAVRNRLNHADGLKTQETNVAAQIAYHERMTESLKKLREELRVRIENA